MQQLLVVGRTRGRLPEGHEHCFGLTGARFMGYLHPVG